MKGQEVHGNYINGFREKISFGAKDHFGPKMARRHNSGSTLRIFLKFCIMKGAKRYMKIILMVSLKKISFCADGPFWAQKWCDFITLDPL